MQRLAIALWLALAPAHAAGLRVIDGDTFEAGGRVIRLEGIDAPELKQQCRTPSGVLWPCGGFARLALQGILNRWTPDCTIIGQDRWGRDLGRCTINGKNLNGFLVEQGYAFAFLRYSQDYAAAEHRARAARRGFFDGEITPPWEWRKQHED